MTFALPYNIAVFTGQTCQFFASVEQSSIAHALQQQTDDNDRREASLPPLDQSFISTTNVSTTKRMVVLIPDHWLKITKPILEHPVSAQLLPLAALSYAVEVTFTTPQDTHYAFLQERLNHKQTRLTIFACAQDWLEALLAPFKAPGQSVIAMSFSQYQSLKKKSWSGCFSQRLTSFQPNFQRQQKVRQYLWMGVAASVLLQGIAGAYYYQLHSAISTTGLAHEQILDVQSTWLQDQQSQAFPLSALNLVQGLPKQVRVEQFYAYHQQANMQVMLPKSMLQRLQESWQADHPQWRWSFVQEAISQAPGQELVNAYIQIVADED